MTAPVFVTLKASSDVKNIVGTNPPRIYRHGNAPQDTSKPYVVWEIIAGVPDNNLSDLPTLDRVVVQVDCWHQTDAGVDALMRAVRDAIEPSAHMTAISVDERDPETRLFHVALEFDWFVAR